MAEKTQRDADAEAAGTQRNRMRLDAVLAELVKSGEVSIDASNKIRAKMSEDVNIDVELDASRNVEIHTHDVGGTTESAKLDTEDDDDSPSKTGRYTSKKK